MCDAARPLAVFDLDGTLNQTPLYAVPAHLLAMKEFHAPEAVQNHDFIVSTFGMTSDEYAPLFLPHADADTRARYLKRVSQLEDAYIREAGRPYDGVIPMLRVLRDAGLRTAICSNASLRYISMVLDVLAIAPLIDFVQPLIQGLSKRETLRMLLDQVNPPRAVMVGDRRFDFEAARANRIPSVGCLYGLAPEEARGADYTAESPAHLPPIILRLLAPA